MAPTLGRIEQVPMDEYRRVLGSSVDATLFHQPTWLELTKSVFGLELQIYGWFDESGHLRAVCPVEMQTVLWPIRIGGSPLPRTETPYLGPVFRDGVNPETKVRATQELRDRLGLPYLFVKWREDDCSAESCVGGSCALTAVVNTRRSEEEMLRSMSDSTRSKVRQALKRGVSVNYVDCLGDWVGDYMKLSELTYSRQGMVSPLRRQFIESLFTTSCRMWPLRPIDARGGRFPAGVRKTVGSSGWHAGATLVQHDSVTVAASIFVFDQATVFGLDSVMDRSYQHLRPHNARIWDMMCWASSEGFTELDLVGANIPGIAAFKLGFGAEQRRVCTVTGMSALGRSMNGLRRLLMNARQRLVLLSRE